MVMQGQRSAPHRQIIQQLQYALARVLGVDPAFESVASALDLVLRERDWVTGGNLRIQHGGRCQNDFTLSSSRIDERMRANLELPFDEVDARDGFSHRVL